MSALEKTALISLLLLAIGGSLSHGVYAAPTLRVVDGSGNGSVICAASGQRLEASIILHSELAGNHGSPLGTYAVTTIVTPDYGDTITSMHTSDGHSYDLSGGIASFESSCVSSTTTTVTISGLCGNAV